MSPSDGQLFALHHEVQVSLLVDGVVGEGWEAVIHLDGEPTLTFELENHRTSYQITLAAVSQGDHYVSVTFSDQHSMLSADPEKVGFRIGHSSEERGVNDAANVSDQSHTLRQRLEDVKDVSFVIIFFPPRQHCFISRNDAAISFAISEKYFSRFPEASKASLIINDHVALQWELDANMKSDPLSGTAMDLSDGLNYFASLTGFEDGFYQAKLVLTHGQSGEAIGRPAFTYFAVDEELEGAEGSCEDFWERGREGAGGEKLDIGLEQTHFIYGRGGPWKWGGLYGEQKRADGRRKEEGTCEDGSCDAASSMRRRRMTNVAYKKPVTLSSTGAGASENAVDGIVNVFYSVPFEQSHATTSGKVGEVEWLEVDLGRNEFVRAIDVWGAARARARLQYPMVVDEGSLAPFQVHFITENGETSNVLHFDDHSSVFSRTGILGVARHVRISRQLQDGSAALAVLELQVWAEQEWECSRQCLHGRCVLDQRREDLICECDADWAGEMCNVHMLMTWRHLPFGVGGVREDSFWDQRLFDEAVNDLRAVQFPERCEAADSVNIRFENRGAAATFNYIGGLLSLSYLQGKTLILPTDDAWVYAHNQGCTDFECYFEPWTSCPENTTNKTGSFQMARSTHEMVFAMVPNKFARKGLLFWRVVLAAFLFRVRPDILQELDVNSTMSRMRWSRPVLGIHIRVGDSCNKWALHFNGTCLPLSVHLSAIRTMIDRYGAKTVFIATDDSTVPGRVRKEMARWQLASPPLVVALEEGWLGDRTATSSNFQENGVPASKWIEHRLQQGELEKKKIALQVIMDLLLLAEADIFILHLASNLSRLAFALAIHRQKRIPPFISVDGPMCYHWQICCELSPDGTSTMC